jgi:hypothetical protein
MQSVLPPLFILGLVALAALHLTRTRPPLKENIYGLVSTARALGFAVILQALHFSEEAMTGFHERFPALLGLPPIPFSVFITFNLLWLIIWIASIPALLSGSRFAFFAAWFLALAGMLNGLAHPLLAVKVNGYFPGLASSPFIAGAAILLWLQLRIVTRAD